MISVTRKPLSVRLPPQVLAEVQRLAEADERPLAGVVRRLVVKGLAAQQGGEHAER